MLFHCSQVKEIDHDSGTESDDQNSGNYWFNIGLELCKIECGENA